MTGGGELKAGPELDEMIATKIFGWRPANGRPSSTTWYHPSGYGASRGSWPSYSTDIAAAFQIIEHLRPNYHIDISTCLTDRGETWVVNLVSKGPPDGLIDADGSAPDAPLAICRAVLAAFAQQPPARGA